jgi:hypothetical protein
MVLRARHIEMRKWHWTGCRERSRIAPEALMMIVKHDAIATQVLGVAFAVALTLAWPMTASGEQEVDSRAAFERLKRLVGTWDVTEKSNPAMADAATYSMTGNGSVLIEDMRGATNGAGHMLTAYHLDKGHLVLTHFCGAGNQPRMRIKAVGDGGRRIAFEMYDITNLADPQGYHSTSVDVVFLNDDRVDLEYRGTRAGTKTTQVFQLSRRRAETSRE